MELSNAARAAILEAERLIATVRAEGDLGGYAMGKRAAISLGIAVDGRTPTRVDVCVQAFGHVLVPWKQFIVTLEDQKGDTLRVPLDTYGHGFLIGDALVGVTWLQGIGLTERESSIGVGQGAVIVDISQKRPSKRHIELELPARALTLAAGEPVPVQRKAAEPKAADWLSVELTLVPERTLRITVQALDDSLRNGAVVVDIRSKQAEGAGYSVTVPLKFGEGLRGTVDIQGEALRFSVDDILILEFWPKTH